MQDGNDAIPGVDSQAGGRIDPRGILCMAWAGKGVAWSLPSRIAAPRVLQSAVRYGPCAAWLTWILGAMISLWAAVADAQSPTANAQLTATGTNAYSMTLNNTGTTEVGTFWYSWLPPCQNFMSVLPTNITSPAGWTSSITNNGSMMDGFGILWFATSPLSNLAAGSSLSGFSFDSTLPANQLTTSDTPFYAGTPVGTSVAYTDSPFSSLPDTFVVTPVSEWASAVSGTWSSTGNWTGGAVPNSAGAGAVFSAATTAALSVTLDNPETVGTLQFGNSGSTSAGYTLSGSAADALTLDNSGNGASITVTDGHHSVDAPTILADNLVVTSPTGNTHTWTLSFGTGGSIAGIGKSLTMSGSGGTLILSGTGDYTGGTTVTAGTLIAASETAIDDGTNLTVGAGAMAAFAPPTSALSAETVMPVPEPRTLALLIAGLVVGLGAWRRKGTEA